MEKCLFFGTCSFLFIELLKVFEICNKQTKEQTELIEFDELKPLNMIHKPFHGVGNIADKKHHVCEQLDILDYIIVYILSYTY